MKKLKYVLIALAVIVLCVGGYVLYEFKLKTYDVADAEVEHLLEETFEVQLPDGTTVIIDKDGNIVNDEAISNNNTTSINTVTNSSKDADSVESSENGTKNTDSSDVNNASVGISNNDSTNNGSTDSETSSPQQKLTVADIKAKYAGTFTSLEGQASERLNALLGRAKNEYSYKKNNGESIKYGYFYSKYMGAASGMEANIDAAVNGVISLVEKELQANGYDKSHAQSFKDEYSATKKALREEVLSKGLSLK